jgi:hypothetical protein
LLLHTISYAADPPKLDCSFLQLLRRIKAAASADVLLGSDAGAPPLPAASCMRLGLLDVVSNLQVLAAAQEPAAAAAATAGAGEDAHTTQPCSNLQLLAAARGMPAAAATGGGGGAHTVETCNNLQLLAAAQDPAAAAAAAAADGAGTVQVLTAAGSSASPSEAAAPARPDATENRAISMPVAADHAAFNAAACAVWPDAYYDLSVAHSSHLEVPFRTAAYSLAQQETLASSEGSQQAAAIVMQSSSTTSSCNADQVACFSGIAKGLLGLRCGVPFLRSIPAPVGMCVESKPSSNSSNSSSRSNSSSAHLEPSVQRGGSTFVMNHGALLIPQHAFPVRR